MAAWQEIFGFLADSSIKREREIYDTHICTHGGWRDWRVFIVASKSFETFDVVSFESAPKDEAPIYAHRGGQYLSFRFDIPGKGICHRHFSISNAPNGSTYRITVKRHLSGTVSRWLQDHVVVGEEVLVANPAGDFTLRQSIQGPIVFLAAGVGVTPIMPMLLSLAESGKGHDVSLAYNVASRDRAVFMPRIAQMAHEEVISVDIFLTQQEASEGAHETTNDLFFHAGRIRPEWLIQRIKPATTYYICGPVAFLHDMVKILSDARHPNKQICYEFFGPASDPDLVK